MYMTSSLGSAWNSLRFRRSRPTKAMVSGACQRMLTGLTLFPMPSETSARLTALSSATLALAPVRDRYAVTGDCKRKRWVNGKIVGTVGSWQMKTANAAATLASVVFLKIQEFARRPVQEQARLRAQLEAVVAGTPPERAPPHPPLLPPPGGGRPRGFRAPPGALPPARRAPP